MNFINEINDILWTYILIIMLLGCARLVQHPNAVRTVPYASRNDCITQRVRRKRKTR